MLIRINIQIFVVIILFILTKQIEIYAWLMGFALIHECAHAIMGIILKLKPKVLEIQPFWIVIAFESFENTEKNKILIALAGPVINIIIALAFMTINIDKSQIIVNTNLVLAICNLLPIYPLDGGRILKSYISIRLGSAVADNITNKIANILLIILAIISIIITIVFHNIGVLLILLYLYIIVRQENKRTKMKKRIRNLIEKQKNT